MLAAGGELCANAAAEKKIAAENTKARIIISPNAFRFGLIICFPLQPDLLKPCLGLGNRFFEQRFYLTGFGKPERKTEPSGCDAEATLPRSGDPRSTVTLRLHPEPD
ncbi:hypothetical protein L6654_08525 [Bradyrhizobium sp. WYCCWR 13023]|uniref:Uncharacterized protein n=1 Tax=Bradyrhizobium zhengyangense TaxID=2911009 RepID=A0A9X1RAH5_9BRAD|nr:hypothetical protein [Bradyrhizobium zhengyangense]MCG2626665.1 hypothetical protein [Bradyrhizobium zhengyangense]